MNLQAACCTVVSLFVVAVHAGPVLKDDCLKCHGPYEALVGKNVQVESDGGPVNPHVYVPHDAGAKGEIPECIGCHTPHPLPPPAGYHEPTATIEGCYGCHHTYEFKKCSGCHKSKG